MDNIPIVKLVKLTRSGGPAAAGNDLVFERLGEQLALVLPKVDADLRLLVLLNSNHLSHYVADLSVNINDNRDGVPTLKAT